MTAFGLYIGMLACLCSAIASLLMGNFIPDGALWMILFELFLARIDRLEN